MDRLPTEILIHILQELIWDSRDAFDRSYIKDLKALRLSYTIIEPLAAGFLFSDIWLFMDGPSFEKLASVSAHTSFRHSVQIIHIFPMLRSENLIRKEIYRREVKATALTVSNLSWLGVQGDGCRELSDEEIEVGYVEYLKLIDNQTRFRHLAKSRLCDAFSAFTHLTTIEAGLRRVFIRDNPGLQEFGPEAFARTVCCGDATTLIIAIALSHCPIENLLLAEIETWPKIANFTATFLDLSSTDFRLVHGVFKGLKSFSVRLIIFDEVGRQHPFGERRARKCQRLLKAASNLETLVIGDIGNRDVTAMKNMFTMVIGSTLWPCLQQLSLVSCTVEESPLSNLLRRHKLTLRKLHISCLILTRGSWYKTLASLRGNWLIDFEATRLSRHVDVANDWMLDVNDRTSCDAVRKFVLGGDWSPKLDPRFSESI